jgi:glycosyltransferase involved in cell wall biosynthesis
VNLANVSVVIPHYKSFKSVEVAIDSVLAQTVQVGEVIVVDDGSGDPYSLNSLKSQYLSNSKVKILEFASNRGPAAARNFGVLSAKFDYVAFLDSDDAWMPHKIEVQYEIMRKNDLNMSAHYYEPILRKNGTDLKLKKKIKIKKISLLNFLLRNPFFTPTVMVKREGFSLFSEKFYRMEDYECWIKNVQRGSSSFICETLAYGFKPPLGFSGLTASVFEMHKGCLAVLLSLKKEKKISLGFFFVATFFELIKYRIRLAKFFLKNIHCFC